MNTTIRILLAIVTAVIVFLGALVFLMLRHQGAI